MDPNGIIMGNIDEYPPSDFVVENLDTTVPVVTVSINDETPNMPIVSLVSGVEDADGYALIISTVEDVVWESPVISTFHTLQQVMIYRLLLIQNIISRHRPIKAMRLLER